MVICVYVFDCSVKFLKLRFLIKQKKDMKFRPNKNKVKMDSKFCKLIHTMICILIFLNILLRNNITCC